MTKVNLSEKFDLFSEAWTPKIAGQVNDMHVKLAKFRGDFDWHSHATEDELFLVVKGEMRMAFRAGFIIAPARWVRNVMSCCWNLQAL